MSATTQLKHHLTIVDIKNKFIVFTNKLNPIIDVMYEWGMYLYENQDFNRKLFLDMTVACKL